MKTIAFIDNFIETPVNHCVNEFILRNKLPCTYHQPARFGFKSLTTIENPNAYIVLGSASHVTNPETWHKELLDLLIPKLEQNIPILGICFGHQLFAKHFGCEVDFIDGKSYELIRDLHFTKNIWENQLSTPFPMPYAHAQCVKKISNEFEIFAKTDHLAYEGLKHKKYPLWTIQGHPEASLEFIMQNANISDKSQALKIKASNNLFLDSFAKML